MLTEAERVGVYPRWKETGSLIRTALRSIDASGDIREKMSDLKCATSPVDFNNCTKEIRSYLKAAIAARTEKMLLEDARNTRKVGSNLTRGTAGTSINTFGVDLKGTSREVVDRVCNEFKGQKFSDKQALGIAKAITNKAKSESFKKSTPISAFSVGMERMQRQLTNGQPLQLPAFHKDANLQRYATNPYSRGKGGKGSKGGKGGKGRKDMCPYGSACKFKDRCKFRHPKESLQSGSICFRCWLPTSLLQWLLQEDEDSRTHS